MAVSRFSLYTLLFVLAVVGYLSFEVIRPFLTPIVWAVFFAVVFYPVYVRVLRRVKSPKIASALLVTLICIVIIGPFSLLVYVLLNEISLLSEYLQDSNLQPQSLIDHPAIKSLVSKLFPFFGMTDAQFDKMASANLMRLGQWIAKQVPKGAVGIFGAVFNFIFMTIILFFLFVDGPRIVERFLSYLPFSSARREQLREDVRDLVTSAVHGGLFTALSHGILGTAAFAIVDIPSALVLGLTVSITAFVPVVGSLIIWVPVISYLALTSHLIKALALTVIGGAGIIIIDNVLRPLFIRGGTEVPFLLVFFGAFGGLEVFGLMGIILGPLVLAVFLSLINFTREIPDRQLRAPAVPPANENTLIQQQGDKDHEKERAAGHKRIEATTSRRR